MKRYLLVIVLLVAALSSVAAQSKPNSLADMVKALIEAGSVAKITVDTYTSGVSEPYNKVRASEVTNFKIDQFPVLVLEDTKALILVDLTKIVVVFYDRVGKNLTIRLP